MTRSSPQLLSVTTLSQPFVKTRACYLGGARRGLRERDIALESRRRLLAKWVAVNLMDRLSGYYRGLHAQPTQRAPRYSIEPPIGPSSKSTLDGSASKASRSSTSARTSGRWPNSMNAT